MQLTYIVAIVQIIFAVVGMAFGWITGAVGSGLIIAAVGIFGARASQTPVPSPTGVGTVKGIW